MDGPRRPLWKLWLRAHSFAAVPLPEGGTPQSFHLGNLDVGLSYFPKARPPTHTYTCTHTHVHAHVHTHTRIHMHIGQCPGE